MKYYIFIINLLFVSLAVGQDLTSSTITSPLGLTPIYNNKTPFEFSPAGPVVTWKIENVNGDLIMTKAFNYSGTIIQDSIFRYINPSSYSIDIDSKPVAELDVPYARKIQIADYTIDPSKLSALGIIKDIKTTVTRSFDLSNSENADPIQLSKGTSTSYITYPVNANGHFEIRENELKTLNGTTTALSTTTVSALIWNNRATTILNGAEIVERHIADERLIGSGKVAWFVATAPTSAKEVSVELNTFANFQSGKNAGAFNINTTSGVLQLATLNKNDGKVGWAFPNAGSTLELSAAHVYTDGDFTASGVITSEKDLVVRNLLGDNLTLTPNRITFSTDNNIASLADNTHTTPWFRSLIINSENSGGILLNASGEFTSIRFSLDSKVVGQFMNDSMILGRGFYDPSAILVIESNSRGMLIPRLYDEEIFEIKNPSEGLQVYNKTHHCPAYFDGHNWRLVTGSVKLERPSKNNVSVILDTKEL